MNSSPAHSAISSAAEQYDIQPNSNFRDTDFCSEKYHMTAAAGLYFKHEDEPDFDCEFLHGSDEALMKKIV